MNFKYMFVILMCVVLPKFAKTAKILGIFHVPSKSHYILGSALLLPLAEKGHEVTMISPYKIENPHKNYVEVLIEGAHEVQEKSINAVANPNNTKFEMAKHAVNFMFQFAEMFWTNKPTQDLIKSDKKFDVIVLDGAFSHSMLALGQHYDAPTIVFACIGSTAMSNQYLNNPNAVYTSSLLMPLTDETSFFERLRNVVMNVFNLMMVKYVINPRHQKLLDTYYPTASKVEDLLQNISLVLLNSHFSFETPRPFVPNYIQIGGFYMTKTKKLPSDIQQFLDDAKEGVVVFCFGSNLKIGDLDQAHLKAIIKGLESVAPKKVIFKSEIELENIGSNINVSKWIPQNDILAHPNVKALVTHGGLGGITESLAHGVPTIIVPFFADQESNAAEAVKQEISIQLKYEDLTEDSFSTALKEILNNPKYAQNAKLKGQIFKDQPIDPSKKATFWIEHVIKYKGAPHLRNAGMKLTWYQNYMVDIILFIAGSILLVLFIVYKVLKCLVKLLKCKICRSNPSSKLKQS